MIYLRELVDELDPDEVDFPVDPRIQRITKQKMEGVEKKHVHRWTPLGNPVRFYQCHCGKTQKRQPVDQRDVQARKKMSRDLRKLKETNRDPDEVDFPIDPRIAKIAASTRQVTNPFQ